MNLNQEIRFNMYLTTVDYCDANTAVIDTLPNFDISLSAFKAVCNEIHATIEEQASNTSGTTAGKAELRLNLTSLTADTARKLTAYAIQIKNKKLQKETDYSLSDLNRLADAVLCDTAKLIYDRAQAYLSNLSSYQITEATQAALIAAIDAFKLALSSPRIEIVNQTQLTRKMIELFNEGNNLLVTMDSLVEIVRQSNEIFYIGYKSARKLVKTGKRKLAVKVNVADQQTQEGIKGVIVSFYLNGEPGHTILASDTPALVKKTGEKGGLYVRTLDTGAYQLVMNKEGYAQQTVTAYVNEGELTYVEALLEKV